VAFHADRVRPALSLLVFCQILMGALAVPFLNVTLGSYFIIFIFLEREPASLTLSVLTAA